MTIDDASSIELVLAAWLDLKRTILGVSETLGLEDAGDSVAVSLKHLKKRDVINAQTVQVIQDLEELKNKAINTPSAVASEDEARQYAIQTQALVRYFQNLSE
jgi:hypothetical protein